ncbi:hypothetical protein JCM3770_001226 [Rhodotorula araucariae]
MASNPVNFPPKRNPHGGGGRPAPHRAHSNSARATPYSRTPPAPLAADGKWQHDLFGERSNLYRPTLNTAAVRSQLGINANASSPSLRPFGDATPAAQPIIRTIPNGPAAAMQAPASNTAIGIKGQSAAALRQAEMAARKERAGLLRQRKVLEAKRAEALKHAQEEEKGFVVQVEGLVSGTSAEDVQTAFSAYGEIVYCYVVDANAADLVARLTFSRHNDASDACAKLDGAIADGRPLSVKQVDRMPRPAPLPPLPPIKPVSTVAPSHIADGVPTGPRANRRAAVPAVAIPAAPPRKMYADEIEAAQQEALAGAGGSVSMDVDMESVPAVPTGPRGRGSRNAAGGAGVGGASAAQRAPATNPLMARLGVVPAAAPSAPAAMRQQQQQPAGLAARLGVIPGRGPGQGKGGRGVAAGAPPGSLLARLA